MADELVHGFWSDSRRICLRLAGCPGECSSAFARNDPCARNLILDGIVIWCVVWALLSAIRAILRQRYVPKVLLVLVCGIPALAGVTGYYLSDFNLLRTITTMRTISGTQRMSFWFIDHRPWILGFIAATILGLVNFNIQRSLRELGANVCHQCEYDLTGNVSGVCPECGTKIASRSKRG